AQTLEVLFDAIEALGDRHRMAQPNPFDVIAIQRPHAAGILEEGFEIAVAGAGNIVNGSVVAGHGSPFSVRSSVARSQWARSAAAAYVDCRNSRTASSGEARLRTAS